MLYEQNCSAVPNIIFETNFNFKFKDENLIMIKQNNMIIYRV